MLGPITFIAMFLAVVLPVVTLMEMNEEYPSKSKIRFLAIFTFGGALTLSCIMALTSVGVK